MRNPWRGLGGLPREIWILFAANLVNRAGMMVLPMLIIYLTHELGFTPGRAGFVFAVFGIASIIIGPVAGRLSDRVGAAAVMRLSFILAGVLILFYPMARSYAAVLAVTAFWAAASELFRPASLSAITGLVPPAQRKAAFAVHRLSINLGMSIGPALGGFLAAISFRWMFIVDGLTSIIAGLILASAAWSPYSGGEEPGPDDEQRAPVAERLLTPRFLVFLAGVFVTGIVFFQHEGPMPLFIVQQMHLTPAFYGFLFTVNTLMIVVLEVPLNIATSSWKNRDMMVIAALLFAVGFGAFAFVTTPTGVIAAVAVWTFGEMFLFPSMSAHMGDIAPTERRGTYMGAYSMAINAALALGPWLGTAVYSQYGNSTLWIAMFFIGAVGAVLFFFATPTTRALRAEAAAES